MLSIIKQLVLYPLLILCCWMVASSVAGTSVNAHSPYQEENPQRTDTVNRPTEPERPTLPTRPSSSMPTRLDQHRHQPVQKTESKTGQTYIELRYMPKLSEHGAVVQWQGASGNWYDVDGWYSGLDDDGKIRWWVAPKDYNNGPFRWSIFQSVSNEILWSSDSFDLPEQNQTLILVETGL